MTPTEGVALYQPGMVDFFQLFMPGQVGRGRGLNPAKCYCAMRWHDYGLRDNAALRRALVRVEAHKNGEVCWVRPVDAGPAVWTGRIIDLSPGAIAHLGLKTDDVVDVAIQLDGHWVRF